MVHPVVKVKKTIKTWEKVGVTAHVFTVQRYTCTFKWITARNPKLLTLSVGRDRRCPNWNALRQKRYDNQVKPWIGNLYIQYIARSTYKHAKYFFFCESRILFSKGNEGVNLKMTIVLIYDFFERFSSDSLLELFFLARLEGFFISCWRNWVRK